MVATITAVAHNSR